QIGGAETLRLVHRRRLQGRGGIVEHLLQRAALRGTRRVDGGRGRTRLVGLVALAARGEHQRDRERARHAASHAASPWHFLYFLPLPHEHGSLRPTFSDATMVPWRSPGRRPDTAASNASMTTSVGLMIVL